MRSSVVLPQPEGPSSVKNSPASIDEADVVDGREVAEAARDIPDFEKRHLLRTGAERKLEGMKKRAIVANRGLGEAEENGAPKWSAIFYPKRSKDQPTTNNLRPK